METMVKFEGFGVIEVESLPGREGCARGWASGISLSGNYQGKKEMEDISITTEIP